MSKTKCAVCSRDPNRMNSSVAECSHVDCPSRRKAWADRPTGLEDFKGPWPKQTDSDPTPVDVELRSIALALAVAAICVFGPVLMDSPSDQQAMQDTAAAASQFPLFAIEDTP